MAGEFRFLSGEGTEVVLLHTLALHMKRYTGREVKRWAARAKGPEAEILRRLKWTFSLDDENDILSVGAWSIFYQIMDGPYEGEWIPRDPFEPGFEVAMPYSVLLRDNISVGVDELADEPSAHIVPNPAREYIGISWSTEVGQLTVHDPLGKLVCTNDGLHGKQRLELSIAGWTDGMYTVRFHGTDANTSLRFIKY